MKVAVTSQGDQLTSEVDLRFGRASWFVVLDTKTGEHESVDNSKNVDAAQGAGVQAAQTMAELEVDAVVTGHCGPRAYRVLESAGIKVYLGADGTIQSAIERLKSGALEEADGPSVDGPKEQQEVWRCQEAIAPVQREGDRRLEEGLDTARGTTTPAG
jgi:predicted Fe-Mo cluster-binding NifX family protein